MESSIRHQLRALRTKSYVLWPHKLPGDLLSHDKQNIHRGVTRRMGIDLYGRHINPHGRELTLTPRMRPPNTGETREARPLPET